MARMLERFEARTGVPVVVNTSLNTAGRPMVDDPRDALECFGSAPVDLLAIGPFVVRRAGRGARAGASRGAGRRVTYDVVIPTAGRPSLRALLAALAAGPGPAPERVVVVDDRRRAAEPLLGSPGCRPCAVEVVRGPARGPAAARNAGWRAGAADWVVFLDDDVVPEPGWRAALAADLAAAGPDVGGVQGRIVVPLPADRRPDGLGAQHGRARARALGDGRPRLPAGRRSRRSAASTSASRAPTARTPTSACGSPRRAGGSCAGAARSLHPVRPAPRARLAGQAGGQRRRRAHARAPRPRLARARRRPGGPAPAPPGGGGGGRAGAWRAAAARAPRVGGRRRRGLGGRDARSWPGRASRPGPRTPAEVRDDGVDERADAVRGDGLVARRPRDAAPPPGRAGPGRRRGLATVARA